MKTLILFILCFWLLPALPACDEAIPDYPINVIDDGLYLFLEADDRYMVMLSNGGCVARVIRSVDEDTSLVFEGQPDVEILHVHISKQPEF